MASLESLLVWGVASPLISFVLLVFFGARLGKPLAGYVACLGMGVSTVLAGMVTFRWLGMDEAARRAAAQTARDNAFHWADLGDIPLTLGVNLDSLTVVMFMMVTFIAFWIFFFSLGYMSGHSDEVDGRCHFHRFFTYLSLFGFSMLGLVISSSLVFLFVFWELVGVCSYFLIGFYFDRKYASNAGMKAFITNRVGDFGFIIGLMMVIHFLRDPSLAGAARAFAEQHASGTGLFAPGLTFLGVSAATWMGVGLFCGAIGKSAQVPLQVWLPDAMAGPTPVSALIHAATMVAAGVYLVARIFLLLTPGAQFVVAVIGCITLALAALVAIVQTDIKKVLAYSTLSQLGYMIFGLGVGAWIGALFHLLTHAFFKALMFLGSGQVIEGCHHEQDIRKMGGLIRKMPVTAVTFLIGVLAIAGFGIPGLVLGDHLKLGLGGFFSKDEILAVAYYRTHDVPVHDDHADAHASAADPRPAAAAALTPAVYRPDAPAPALLTNFSGETPAHGASPHQADTAHGAPAAHDTHAAAADAPKLPRWLFWVPILIAYVTPFYMMRCWWLTFMGKPRDHHVHDHAHESPMMWVPLAVLAVFTLVSSYFICRPLVADAAPAGFLVPSIDGEHHPAMHTVHGKLVPIVGFAYLVGFLIAIALYRRGLGLADGLKRAFRPLNVVLERKFFFDDVYDNVLVHGTVDVARFSAAFDKYVVDLLVNITALLTERLAALSGWVLDATGVVGGLIRRPRERAVAWVLGLAGAAGLVYLLVLGQVGWALALAVLLVVLFGIDGMANGLATGTFDLAGTLRSTQTGAIRNYVLFAAAGATVLLLTALLMIGFGRS